MSPDALVSIGAETIGISFVVGLVAVLALYSIGWALEASGDGALLRGYVVLAVTLVAVLVLVTATFPSTWNQRTAEWIAGIIPAILLVGIARRKIARGNDFPTRRAALLLFLVVAAVGGIVGIIRDSGPPADFDMATLFLKDGVVTTGAYLGTDSTDYYFAPELFERIYGHIAMLPRDAVARVDLSKPPVPYVSVGEADPNALLGGTAPVADHLTSSVEQWLPTQVGYVDWTYPPLTYDASGTFLSKHAQQYFGSLRKPVSAGTVVGLDRLVFDAIDYAGGPITTAGYVTEVASVPFGAIRPTGQFVTIRAPAPPAVTAICYTPTPKPYPVGAQLTMHGLLIATGITQTSQSRLVQGAYLVCSNTTEEGLR